MASTSKAVEKAPRKRGPNYTEAEKENLRTLTERYTKILELKSTGSLIFKKKAAAWAQLTQRYNALATTGIRTPEQLKHLYENLKQNSKKALATSNDEVLDLEKLKVLDKSDKIDHKKTGGGCFTPAIADKNLKNLEYDLDQVEPLSNPYDSAAAYFNDNVTQEPTQEPSQYPENMVVVEIMEEETLSEKPKGVNQTTNFQNKDNIPTRKLKKGLQHKTRMTRSLKKSNYYKNMYFKVKYQNALLERRKILQDIRFRQKEHLLISKKIKLEISNLEKN